MAATVREELRAAPGDGISEHMTWYVVDSGLYFKDYLRKSYGKHD